MKPKKDTWLREHNAKWVDQKRRKFNNLLGFLIVYVIVIGVIDLVKEEVRGWFR